MLYNKIMKRLLTLLTTVILLVPTLAQAQFTAQQGGTGNTSYGKGDILYSGSVNPLRLSKITIGSDGECLKALSALPVWGSCGSSSGTGTVATSTNETTGYWPYWTSTSATPATLGATSTPFFSGFNFSLATGTQATTTNLFSTSGTFTNLFGTSINGFSLSTCNSAASALTWSAGSFGCHTISTGAGGGAGTWATTTSTVSGELINYPLNNTDIVAIGNSATSSAIFYFDPNTSLANILGTASTTHLLSVGSSTIGDASQTGGLTISGGATTTAAALFQSTVSINPPSAAVSLSMTGNSSSVANQLSITDTTTSGNSYTSFVNPSGTSNANTNTVPLTGTFSVGNGTTGGLLFNTRNSGAPIQFYTGGNSLTTNFRMTILGSGNVGINTKTPATTLDIQGDASTTNLWVANNSTTTNATTTTLSTSKASTTSLWISGVKSALLLTDSTGAVSGYAGVTCTNQFLRALSAVGGSTCATVANTDLANSTISGISLGSSLADLTFSTGLSSSGVYNGGTARTLTVDQSFSPHWTGTHIFDLISLSTTTQATTTSLYVSGNASTSKLYLGTSPGVLTVGTTGLVAKGTNGTDYTLITGTTCSGTDKVSAITAAGAITCSIDQTAAATPNSKWATSTADSFAISPNSAIRVGIGTTTPQWALQIASSTGPQLTLSDTSLTSNHWSFRNKGGTFYLATSSPTTFATSTTAAFSIDLNGVPTFPSVGTGLVLSTSGAFGPYAGTSCTNQFVRSLSASGAATCATVGAADVSLANLTATDSTLTFSGTYNGSTARTIGLTLSNGNVWTAASTTFSGGVTITKATTTQATTTSLYVSGNASTSKLYLGTGNGVLTVSSGLVSASTLLGLANGGTNAALSGANDVIFMNSGNTALSTDSSFHFNSAATRLAIGTSTAQGLATLTIGSSTRPQLNLVDNSLTSDGWSFRNKGGTLYIATTSPSTYATSTPAAFSILDTGNPSLSIATSTCAGSLCIGGLGSSASSTIIMGKVQIDGYTNAGSRVCAYIVGTAWVIQSGACTP